MGACASATETRRGEVSARSYYLADDRGLSIVTVGLSAEQQLSRVLKVGGHALVDQVRAKEATQRAAADVVTGASALVVESAPLDETRVEAAATGELVVPWDQGSLRLGAGVRASEEPDYHARSARCFAALELFERNTVFEASGAYGSDLATPQLVPPGQASLWPASIERAAVTLAVSQVVSRRLLVSTGVDGARHVGVLWSPYRRAEVRGELLPERLPSERHRLTGFGAASVYLGGNTAAHLRLAGYADDWGVRAVSPELAVVHEVSERLLLRLRYRHLAQGPAHFFRPRYDELASARTADARLGALLEHEPAGDVIWVPLGRRGHRGSVELQAGYGWSHTRYLSAQRLSRTHQLRVGLSAEW